MRYMAIVICTILSAMIIVSIGSSNSRIHYAGSFSTYKIEDELPDLWEPLSFRGKKDTDYRLYEIDGKVVVKAESDRSASGLIRRVDIDPEEYPVLRWSWRVENILEKGDVTEKSGDDYPARIYVTFDYDIRNLSWWDRTRLRAIRTFYGEVPTRAINYLWESSAEVGTIVPNPYSDLVMMVVVESGEGNLGTWVHHERNIYEDYVKIFGEEPPKINSVAIMTDTDDTGESAVAYYGDIKFIGNGTVAME
jgi:hypothetical protein